MSDFPRDRAASTRGLRIGVVSVLVALAFLIGLALGVVLVRRQTAGSDIVSATPALADSASPMAGSTLAPAQPVAVVPAQPTTDAATLAAREAALAGQIAALEARAAALSASAQIAGGQASRAEALLIAIAARRALDRGMALGSLDEQLRGRFGAVQPRAVLIVREAARQPVTLEDLRFGLTTLAPMLATGADRGWAESIREGFRTLVVLRRVDEPSSLPADRLSRARRLLDQGQVEAARAEVAQLPGAGQASGWLTAAHRYVLARQALDVLENASLAGQAQPAPLVVRP